MVQVHPTWVQGRAKANSSDMNREKVQQLQKRHQQAEELSAQCMGAFLKPKELSKHRVDAQYQIPRKKRHHRKRCQSSADAEEPTPKTAEQQMADVQAATKAALLRARQTRNESRAAEEALEPDPEDRVQRTKEYVEACKKRSETSLAMRAARSELQVDACSSPPSPVLFQTRGEEIRSAMQDVDGDRQSKVEAMRKMLFRGPAD